MGIKKRSCFTRRALRLLPLAVVGVSLASCDFLGIKNPWGDPRDPQVVSGPRRAPIYNPQGAQAAAKAAPYTAVTSNPITAPVAVPVAAASVAPMPAPLPPINKQQVAADANPYDAYDASGNEIVPPKATNTAPQSDFFGRMFSGGGNDGAVRKPLSGNPYYHDVTPAPPAAVAPQSALQSVQPVVAEVEKPVVDAPKNNPEPAANAAITVPVATVATVPAAAPSEQLAQNDTDSSSQSSWWDRWLGKHSGNVDDPARSKPTPALSSVPGTPGDFQMLKDTKVQTMQDLQSEHIEAQQEKQQLDNEPSQQPQGAPVEIPMPAKTADAPKPAPAVEAQPSAEQKNVSAPAAPEHMESALPAPVGAPSDDADEGAEEAPAKTSELVVPASVYSGSAINQAPDKTSVMIGNSILQPPAIETIKVLPTSPYATREQMLQQQAPAQ